MGPPIRRPVARAKTRRRANSQAGSPGWCRRTDAELIRVARHEGLQGEDALDAVQEALSTFLTLPAARALPDDTDDARNLLVAITRNAARNRRRLAAVSRPHVSDDALLGTLAHETPDAEQRLAASQEQTQLRSCVERLGDVQRAVVTLRLLDELDGDDVARALGITRSHVAVLLHRAKANLHACMTAGENR